MIFDYICVVTDLEYWKAPSRKLYVAKKSEYEDVIKIKSRKRLSLNRRKQPTTYFEEYVSDEETSGISRVESKLEKVLYTCTCTQVNPIRNFQGPKLVSLIGDPVPVMFTNWKPSGKVMKFWALKISCCMVLRGGGTGLTFGDFYHQLLFKYRTLGIISTPRL